MSPSNLNNTREEWLLKTLTNLNRLFLNHGAIIPDHRVSMSWPIGNYKKVIGQYFPSSLHADGIASIYISPSLPTSVAILEVYVHELVHACTPGDGHGKAFGRLARAIGLDGKLTATKAGAGLLLRLNELIAELGEIPSSPVTYTRLTKKQTTRLVKVQCSNCGYICRVTNTWLIHCGTPLCRCNGDAMQEVIVHLKDLKACGI